MTTPPQDPFGTPRKGEGAPSDRPSWESSGYGQQHPSGQGYGPVGYGQPAPGGPPGSGSGPYGPQDTRTEPKAIVAIVLAVLAWTPTVPFIGAIAALVLARMSRRDIAASGGRLTGLSLCTWATVLSWVHLVVIALAVVLGLLLFALPVVLSL